MASKRKKNRKKQAQATEEKVDAAPGNSIDEIIAAAAAQDEELGLAEKKLGNEAFVQKKYAKAIQHFTAAIRADNTEHVYFSNRSACYAAQGKWAQALKDANQCVRMSPNWAKGYARKGAAQLGAGDPFAAKVAFNKAVQMDPANKSYVDDLQEANESCKRKQRKIDLQRERDERDNPNLDDGLDQLAFELANKGKVTVDDDKKDDGKPKVVETIIGIDLGTTYSCVAVWKDGKPVVIANLEGKLTTPSWVAFGKDGERFVGENAKRRAAREPERTLFNIKRLIGREFSECRDDIKRMPFEVMEGKGSKPTIKIDVLGNGKKVKFAPEQISAMVLEEMKAIAENYLGFPVHKAVITVPAYFNDSQRRQTMDAGAIAGLEVMRIINEPTAAALAYGLHKKGTQNVLVFDLGGGTFDVSLLKIEDGVFTVLATAGDTHLGGEDFDSSLADWVRKLWKKKHGKDPFTGNTKAISKLRTECEKAKRILSGAMTTMIEVFVDGVEVSVSVKREQFEKINEAIFQRCMKSVERVMKDSKVDDKDVTDIVLVGGSTRVPRVREILSKKFGGRELCKSVNADEAVAYGAAVQGAILSGVEDPATRALLLVDVIPLSLGVETQGGHFARVVPRNTSVPCKKSSEFTTVDNYQTAIDIRVFEGERGNCEGNHLLGSFSINGIQRAKKGEAKVDVTFEMSTDGLLTVSAKDQVTGAEANVELQHDKGRLSQDEIDGMYQDAIAMRELDNKARRAYQEEQDRLAQEEAEFAAENGGLDPSLFM